MFPKINVEWQGTDMGRRCVPMHVEGPKAYCIFKPRLCRTLNIDIRPPLVIEG